MHVALVSTTFPVPEPGRDVGIERLAKGVTDGLLARGIDVTIVTTFWNGGPSSEDYGQAKILRVRDTSAFLGRLAALGDSHYWSWGVGVARTLRQIVRPDIVHSLAPLASTAALRKASLPVVTTFHHSEEIWRMRDLLHKPFHTMLESRAYLASTLLITPSKASAEAIERRFGVSRNRIRTIPWGVDPLRFHPGGSHSSRVPQILYVGLHEPRKGLVYLLEAISILHRDGIPVHLTTVGRGPQMPELQRLARKLEISDSVSFFGYVADPDDQRLPQLYSHADLFVLPSLKEGFGFVLLEAMASGVPVIASDVSAIPEVVGDAGVLFPPGNSVALANALRNLVANPQRRTELARRGRERVEALFTWDKVISRLLSTYAEAIDLAGRHS